MPQLVSLDVNHLGKKPQPYRVIQGFSVNEHLKNANFRNKGAHRSHIQAVSFGYLYFYSLLKTLLGRQQTEIY